MKKSFSSHKYIGYRIKMYDLTTAVKKLLALMTLKEDKEKLHITYKKLIWTNQWLINH